MTADHEAQRQATSPMSDYERGLRDAWQAVDAAIRPLGYGPGVGSNSPWNKGYEQAKNEGLNAILALMEAQRGNAQRQAADSQATDQGALLDVIHRVTCGDPSCERTSEAEAILSALAEAGYTVVKTRYEYAGSLMHEGRTDTRIRRIVGPWVPVPEGSADRGSEEGGER